MDNVNAWAVVGPDGKLFQRFDRAGIAIFESYKDAKYYITQLPDFSDWAKAKPIQVTITPTISPLKGD